ncbi:unnamed protein product, partial [Choristocarpus tenellus]
MIGMQTSGVPNNSDYASGGHSRQRSPIRTVTSSRRSLSSERLQSDSMGTSSGIRRGAREEGEREGEEKNTLVFDETVGNLSAAISSHKFTSTIPESPGLAKESSPTSSYDGEVGDAQSNTIVLGEEDAAGEGWGPLLEGVLKKKNGRINSWSERYFVLRRACLEYYGKQSDVGVVEPRAIFDLHPGCVLTTMKEVRASGKVLFTLRISWPQMEDNDSAR